MNRIILLASFSILLFLHACQPKDKETEPNIIVVQSASLPDKIHPSNGIDAFRSEMLNYLHARLLREDIQNFGYSPDLLAYLPQANEDKTIYSCQIRDKIRFDNGEELSIDDIIFSFKVHTCPFVLNGSLKSNLSNLKNIIKVDDLVFQIVYDKAQVQDLSMLTLYPILQESYYDSAQVLRKYAIEDWTDSMQTEAHPELSSWATDFNGARFSSLDGINGLGAYKVTSWDETQFVLERKELHWSLSSGEWFHRNNAERIIFKLTPDANARNLELKNHSIDLARGINSMEMKALMEDTSISNHYNMYQVPIFGMSMLILNLQPDGTNRKNYLTTKEMRQAFAHLLPVDTLIQKLSNGTAVHIANPVSILKKEHNDKLRPRKYNKEKAAELLAGQGWRDTDNDGFVDKEIDGERVKLQIGITIRNSPAAWADMAKVLVEGLREGGIDAKIESLESSAWAKALLSTKDFDAFLLSISNSFGPEYPLSLYESTEYPSGKNFSGYTNAEVDSLIDLISVTYDETKRRDLLFRFQEIVYDELPYVFLTTGKRGVLVHKRFGEVEPSGAMPMLYINTLEPMD